MKTNKNALVMKQGRNYCVFCFKDGKYTGRSRYVLAYRDEEEALDMHELDIRHGGGIYTTTEPLQVKLEDLSQFPFQWAAIAKILGYKGRSRLANYLSGYSQPSPEERLRIENLLHQLGAALTQIKL